MDFRFLHAADLHLDTPFKGIGSVEPFVAEALRDASLEAFEALVDLAIERDVAFVVLAGDIYDGAERGVRAQLAFHRGVTRLADHGIRSFVVHGNHDPVETGWSAIRDWPEQVTVFGHRRVESVRVERDGQALATVHGVSFATREVTDNLALGFADRRGDGFQIGLLHCNVGDQPGHAPYAPCSLDDLRRAGIDYWALGHVHTRQVLEQGDPWIVYPGNLQGRSPKPAERGAKGAVVVDVHDGVAREPEFVALDRVRFEHVDVAIDDLADLPALHGALRATAEAVTSSADGRSVILRATLTGRGAVHDDLQRPDTLDSLLADLRDEQPTAVPFCWWEDLRDASAATVDLDSVRGRGDFAAQLLAVSEELAADAARREQLGRDWLAELPTGVRRALDDLPPGDDPDLWADAGDLALALLEEVDG